MTSQHSMARATIIGAGAIALWSMLAWLTDSAGDIPPFQLLAMCFALATVIGVIALSRDRQGLTIFRTLPTGAWLLGVGGLFGYHFLYFIALRNAPAVEASLIAYLWPLLIVLFSAVLPGERLRTWHILGATMGLLGTLILVTADDGFGFRAEDTGGYLAALGCAVVWAAYSVLNRRYAGVPSVAVAGYCAVTALLAAGCHLLLETTRWPEGGAWWAVIGLGIGPIGLAFYLWDYGTKHGDIRILGTLSYGAPLASTIILILAGRAEISIALGIACLLVTSGALIASGRFRKTGGVNPDRSPETHPAG